MPGSDWLGGYVGIHGGGGSSNVDWTYRSVGTADHDGSGEFGGVQAGFNYYQSGPFVLGVVGDISAAGIDGSTACPSAAFSCASDISMLASVRLKAGWAVGNMLLYGTGGIGFAELEISADNGAGVSGRTKRATTGYTVGGGIEFRFSPNWSIAAEYLRYNFGSEVFTVDNGLRVDADVYVDTGKIALNYRF